MAAGLAVVLLRLGHGPLALPRHWSAAGLRDWAATRDPVTIAMATLRVVALGLAAQVLMSTGLAVIGALTRLSGLVRAAEVFSLPGARGLVRRLAALTVSATTLAAPATPTGPVRHHPESVAEVDTDTSGSAPVATMDRVRTSDDQATMTRLDPGPDAGAGGATMVHLDGEDPPPVPAAMPDGDGAATVWVVRPGDHLWSISAATLQSAWRRVPSEREVNRYWRRVIAANPTLADPDLIFAGQRIALPAA